MAFDKLTARAGAELVEWFRQEMSVQDWTVELYLDDLRPDWVEPDDGGCLGECDPDRMSKQARIWVSSRRCIDDGEDPRSALVHELLHMALADAGVDDEPDTAHCLVLALERVVLRAYLADRAARAKGEGK